MDFGKSKDDLKKVINIPEETPLFAMEDVRIPTNPTGTILYFWLIGNVMRIYSNTKRLITRLGPKALKKQVMPRTQNILKS